MKNTLTIPTLFTHKPGVTAWLDTEPTEANDWLVSNLLYRNTINILDGIGSSGKSYIALQLALSIASGLPFLGLLPVHQVGKVLILNGEDPESVSHARFRAISQNYSSSISEDNLYAAAENITHISMSTTDIASILLDERLQTTKTYADLRQFCAEWKPDLVILDPLSLFAAKENCNSYAAHFYAAMRKLKSTVLVIHHQNKSGMNGEGEDRAKTRGAGVWVENARTRMMMRDSTIVVEKNNYYRKFAIPLEFGNGMWQGKGIVEYSDAGDPGRKEPEPEKKEEITGKRKAIRIIKKGDMI